MGIDATEVTNACVGVDEAMSVCLGAKEVHVGVKGKGMWGARSIMAAA